MTAVGIAYSTGTSNLFVKIAVVYAPIPIRKGCPKLMYPVRPDNTSQLMANIAKKFANIIVLSVPLLTNSGIKAIIAIKPAQRTK